MERCGSTRQDVASHHRRGQPRAGALVGPARGLGDLPQAGHSAAEQHPGSGRQQGQDRNRPMERAGQDDRLATGITGTTPTFWGDRMSAAVMVIAHRGASSYAPENTLAAFDLALRMGVHHIELDVASTSDGHTVVIHDDKVDRTTNGRGLVTDHTLAAL